MDRAYRRELVRQYVNRHQAFTVREVMAFVQSEIPKAFLSERSIAQVLKAMPVERQHASGAIFYIRQSENQ